MKSLVSLKKLQLSSPNWIRLITKLNVFIFICTNVTSTTAMKAYVNRPRNGTIPAVIAIGDSILDTGNNNNLKTLVKSNFPPYGRDFLGGRPTGRFCNGKIPSDFFVEALGIKEFLPAYLNSNLQPQDLLSGVSIASAGSGFDPLTSLEALVYPWTTQLQFLRDYKENLEEIVGEEKANYIFNKSLFLVSSGGNDIGFTYYLQRRFHSNPSSYTSLLVDYASTYLQDMYDLGARRIGVIGVLPVGCLPVLRTIGGGLGRNCVEEINEVTKLFNAKLSSELASLNKDLPDANMFYIDFYYTLLDIIQNYENYGFEVVDRGCCGTGTVETGKICGLNVFTCTDDSTYVFWDGEHPTEKAYDILVSKSLSSIDQIWN